MSMIVGSDFIDNNTSFNTVIRKDGPNTYVQAYATSGAAAGTPKFIQWMGSGYNATAIVASNYGYVGLVREGNAIASGCVGWVQISGQVDDAQSYAATKFTGEVGHAVFVLGTTVGIGATGSGYVGNPAIGQIGVLLEDTSGSTTANIFLTGVWATPIA